MQLCDRLLRPEVQALQKSQDYECFFEELRYRYQYDWSDLDSTLLKWIPEESVLDFRAELSANVGIDLSAKPALPHFSEKLEAYAKLVRTVVYDEAVLERTNSEQLLQALQSYARTFEDAQLQDLLSCLSAPANLLLLVCQLQERNVIVEDSVDFGLFESPLNDFRAFLQRLSSFEEVASNIKPEALFEVLEVRKEENDIDFETVESAVKEKLNGRLARQVMELLRAHSQYVGALVRRFRLLRDRTHFEATNEQLRKDCESILREKVRPARERLLDLAN